MSKRTLVGNNLSKIQGQRRSSLRLEASADQYSSTVCVPRSGRAGKVNAVTGAVGALAQAGGSGWNLLSHVDALRPPVR